MRIGIGGGAATGIADRRAAATVATMRRDANTRTRPVIPTPPQGDRFAPQGSRYLMFPRSNRTKGGSGKEFNEPGRSSPCWPRHAGDCGVRPEFLRGPPQGGRRCYRPSDRVRARRSSPRPGDGRGPHRSVITFVGDRTSVAEAAFRGAKKAVELIDMNRHRGEHPRVGALDVLPFVPIAGVTMDDCVALARSVGKRIAEELQVPVYLYEAAATRPDRLSLPDVRRGEYEGLKKEIETNPDRQPDFGPPRLHPTAGACIVGARPILIAWNVNLRTTDVGVAKRIAKAIRESDGGLPAVRAKGFDLADRGLVQVSMNMVDYRKTSLVQAFEAIRALAAKEGVEIAESEIIGLVPMDALAEAATQYLKLARFHREQILETRLWE